jgi:hypothetical protein
VHDIHAVVVNDGKLRLEWWTYCMVEC